MASLIIMSGKQAGDYYPLGRRTNVVGRDEALPIQILDNMVSRKHLQIRFDQEANRYFAFDMKSRNGVYINTHRIDDETLLKDGDLIQIGLTSLLFLEKDFKNKDSALRHFKKAGERMRLTSYGRLDVAEAPAGPGETAHPVDKE